MVNHPAMISVSSPHRGRLTAAVCCLACACCAITFAGCQDSSTNKGVSSAPAPVAVAETYPSVTAASKPAAKLKSKEMQGDEDQLKPYAKQIVEITGYCNNINGKPGQWMLMLMAEPPAELANVSATSRRSNGFLLQDQNAPWKTVFPGQTVTLLGYRRSESDIDHHLVNCVLTKVEGPRCPELTVEELSKELEQLSTDEFNAKYRKLLGRCAIVTGTIDSVTELNPIFKRSLLRHSGKSEIWLTTGSEALSQILPNRRVRAWGSISASEPTKVNIGVDHVLSVD